MRARRAPLLAAAVVAASLGWTAEAAAQVRVSVTPTRVSTRLGDSFQVKASVASRVPAPRSGLIAHLNIVSVTRGVYVDPEDWSAERTRYLARVGPGKPATASWKVKAVSAGDFEIYVVVLSGSADPSAALGPTVSPALHAHIAEHRTLNSGGVLPLALGVPAALGVLALALRRRRRA
jgi:hypothetical protein